MKDDSKEHDLTEWSLARVIALSRERGKSIVIKSGKIKSNPIVVTANNGTPESATCDLRGDRIPPDEALRIGLGTVRTYFPCGAGRTLNAANVAGVVCSCKGCGPTCPDYRPKENGDEGE